MRLDGVDSEGQGDVTTYAAPPRITCCARCCAAISFQHGVSATASQETADRVAAAMAGKKVKPGEMVAKEEKTEAGTA